MIKPVRVILVLLYFFIIALLGSLISLLRPFNPDNTRICGRMFSWGAVKLMGIRLIVEDAKVFDNMKPCVVIANHQDNLDLFMHGAVIPRRTVSVGKKSLRYLPLFGQVYWLSGNIMIDRSKSRESINAMTETTEALRKKNTSIWVFVEGTRNRGKGLLPFKKGAFHMAKQAGVPIVPICASTYPGKIDLNKWRAGTVILKVLPPIDAESIEKRDLPELRTGTRELMARTIEELDQRVAGYDAQT